MGSWGTGAFEGDDALDWATAHENHLLMQATTALNNGEEHLAHAIYETLLMFWTHVGVVTKTPVIDLENARTELLKLSVRGGWREPEKRRAAIIETMDGLIDYAMRNGIGS